MSKIITLKNKGEISSLVAENFNGISTKFLVPDILQSKKDKLLQLLASIAEKLPGFEVVYEGKINYGFRNKRIEIAILKKPYLFIGKLSNLKKIDMNTFEIERIINQEKNKAEYKNINIIGCMFTENEIDKTIIESIKQLVNNEFIFINIEQNNWFETIKNYVISHK